MGAHALGWRHLGANNGAWEHERAHGGAWGRIGVKKGGLCCFG